MDDEQQGVAAVLSGEASRDASKFLEAPPAEQARRARGVFAALRTQPNRLLRSAAGPALEEVAGRPFPPAEVRLLLGDHWDDVSELQFLKAVRRVAQGGYDVPESVGGFLKRRVDGRAGLCGTNVRGGCVCAAFVSTRHRGSTEKEGA